MRGEHKYYYLPEDKALEEFGKELEMREVVARTAICPRIKCPECAICENMVEELERSENPELGFLLLKMQADR